MLRFICKNQFKESGKDKITKEYITNKYGKNGCDNNLVILDFINRQNCMSFDRDENGRYNIESSTINSTINIDEQLEKIKNKYPELKEIYLDVIKLILQDKYITQDKIASKLNKSRNAISRNIKTLKEFNIIERIGANKDGYWNVKND